ncbi:type VI secretion protein IcmF/TssM N-terminal domain-containing protein [Roseimaritima ulvae]|uniref:Type VI secretion system component TssM1 N-terminal domain-containing protein n=1 Tax=Roseimaritima ulvae TaxID=980254 RepID=A0A5B9QU78_9BACT|nr:type VI secretion protein IcmF/TssM N-terminal domain-containing protein [Roseimaritima ulvae]QEG40596.1 hypothetical protein UC8_26110 [Roseimaritima ulvae]
MLKFLKQSLQSGGKLVLAAVAPMAALRRTDGATQRWCMIGIHVAAMLLLLAGLCVFQTIFQLDSFVRSSLPFVRWAWLPIVGCLFYATAWSAWFVAHTLQLKPDHTPKCAITSALQNGIDQCVRAGIDIQKTPIYLTIGTPTAGIRSFFHSAHTELSVLPTAEEADQPVQVCGNHDAIYICCRDASLTGDFVRRAAQQRVAPTRLQRAVHSGSQRTQLATTQSAHQWTAPSTDTAASATTTGSPAAALATAPTEVQTQPTTSPDNTVGQRLEQTLGSLTSLVEPEAEPEQAQKQVLQPSRAVEPILRLDTDRATELLERLRTLCFALAAVRQPYCPVNGVLILVPLDATDNIETADHVGMRIERDLQTIAEATQSSVSSQVVFCDLEHSPGSQAFLERFPASQRDRRLGTVLPAPPTSEPDAGPAGIDRAVRWICTELFSPLGYRLMARDLVHADQDRELCEGNRGIHQLVHTMRQRREGMSRMLRRAISTTAGQIRLRGCFVAATGIAGTDKQAFAEGLMPLILDLQNEVQWSEQRRSSDRWQRRAAMLTYAIVLAATCLTTALLLGWRTTT